ncbi:MAG: single-stranded DNA-binding protein [Actinomycetaceae bacterium]|nr:single-stranded DNA-binding protein [Actinomycetaceae bacterium]
MAGEPVVTIVGNLTADPELRYVSSGTAVANFTVASTPRNLNRQTNQWEQGEAMFVRCAVWREYAENVAQSLTKGMRVLVTGRLSVRSYQANNGEQRTSIEMQVDEIGPSLRYAQAQVQRINNNSQGSGNFNNNGNYGGGYNASQNNGMGMGGMENDPYGSQQQNPSGSMFDTSEPPF